MLWTLAVIGLAWVQLSRMSDLTYLGADWREPRQMTDFRDAVWLPGRFLLQGGNPYDAEVYKAAHPWAQEFNLYAPAWLLVAVAMALLPFPVAAAVYLAAGAVLLVVFLRVAIRWAAPDLMAVALPGAVIWSALWSPTRYALQNAGTLLVMIGSVLVLGGLVGRPDRAARALMALGIGLSTVKPQFGVPLTVMALAMGWWRAVVRGLVGLAAASAVPLLACVLFAGGPGAFAASIGRNLAFSSSADSPTGIGSAFNLRIDYLGLLARWGVTDQPTWWSVAMPAALLALGCWVLRRRPGDLIALVVAGSVTVLCVVHQSYDVVPLLLAAIAGARRMIGGPSPSRVETLTWLCGSVTVLHLHGVSMRIGVTRLVGDTVDVAFLTAALVLGSVAAWRQPDGSAEGSRASRRA